MFELGVPFGAFVIYAVVWVIGYFIWALRSGTGEQEEDAHIHDGEQRGAQNEG